MTPAMQLAPDDALAGAGTWSAAAAHLLVDLGFTLINGDRPGPDGSHLLVGLRREPTLRHFDPEALGYYAPADARAALVMLDRSTAVAEPARRVLWGHVHVIDRLAVENRFLTFGGTLRAAAIGADLTVLDLRSPGPIVRWGGHSQGTDQLAGEIGAFFGRLIVPIDSTAGAESLIDAATPAELYGAFVLDLAERLSAAERHGTAPSDLDRWLAAERRRLRADEASWQAAETLLVGVGLRS